MSGQISENPILTDLSEVVSRPANRESLQRARLHLLDWIGCAAAGAREPAGEILRADAATNSLSKAFAWGGLGNILEMDDVDKRALLHPGPNIIPAALVASAESGASITALLEGLIRGYDATIRLGRAVGGGHYALFHSTGSCGAIGAAAASASLFGLDQNQTAHAMALAVSQSAGLWHTRHDAESMGKQLHTAAAARAGLHAARLARMGFKGPLKILEGSQGFFEAMCPDGDPSQVLTDPQSDWCIHDVSFKPWPACRHAHAVIDAALEMRQALNGAPTGTIEVRTYDDALKFCDRANPTSVIEAKFSLQHAVAVVLARGAPKLEDFDLSSIDAPELVALRARVSVSAAPAYNDVYPAHFGAEIGSAGQTFRVVDALGDPENPVSESQIRDKAKMLLGAGGCSDRIAEALIERVMTGTGDAQPLMAQIEEVLS